MESRLRNLAVDWLLQLRSHPTLLLPAKSRHLVNRSAKHFKKGDIKSVNTWICWIDIELNAAKMSTVDNKVIAATKVLRNRGW